MEEFAGPVVSIVQTIYERDIDMLLVNYAYKEAPPSDETMNFPEPGYHYSYRDGYEVFIGDSNHPHLPEQHG